MVKIDSKGTVYKRIKDPYAVADKNGALLLVADKTDAENYFEKTIQAYMSYGLTDMAQDILIVPLPSDQKELDKVFSITGYVKRFFPVESRLIC